MQKQPFTQAGFEALQTELYALDDVKLQLEADAIILNFRGWLYKHFELDQDQLDFLDQIDQRAVRFLESQTSFAVANRLAIALEKPMTSRDDKTGKVIKTKSNFEAEAGIDEPMDAEGNLLIQISYEG